MGRKTSGGGGAKGAEAQRAERRRGGAEPSNPSILSLSTSFSVSYHRESWIMFWNQVEKEKKKSRERKLEKERGREVLE